MVSTGTAPFFSVSARRSISLGPSARTRSRSSAPVTSVFWLIFLVFENVGYCGAAILPAIFVSAVTLEHVSAECARGRLRNWGHAKARHGRPHLNAKKRLKGCDLLGLDLQELQIFLVVEFAVGDGVVDTDKPWAQRQGMCPEVVQNIGEVPHGERGALGSARESDHGGFFAFKGVGIGACVDKELQQAREGAIIFWQDEDELLGFIDDLLQHIEAFFVFGEGVVDGVDHGGRELTEVQDTRGFADLVEDGFVGACDHGGASTGSARWVDDGDHEAWGVSAACANRAPICCNCSLAFPKENSRILSPRKKR